MTSRRRATFVVVGIVTLGGVVAALLEWFGLAGACVALLAGIGAVAALDGRRSVGTVAHRLALRNDSGPTTPGVVVTEADVSGLSHEVEAVGTAVRELSAQVESGARAAARAVGGKYDVGELLTEIQALDQLRERYNPRARLPVIGGWALAPTGLMWLVDAVESRTPRTVVECGSGTSTLWIALALRAAGSGKVLALEHKPEFARLTRQHLREHGLEEWAEVIDAPLVDQETPEGVKPWYSVDDVDFGTIDMLVVDGPPSNTGPHARYPALILLGKYLSADAWILMDDTNRPSERQIMDLWRRQRPGLQIVERVGSGSTILRLG